MKGRDLCKEIANNMTETARYNCSTKQVSLPKACVRYFLVFPQNIALPKLSKMLFILSKKLFLFSGYSNFCNFPLSTLSRFKRTSKR